MNKKRTTQTKTTTKKKRRIIQESSDEYQDSESSSEQEPVRKVVEDEKKYRKTPELIDPEDGNEGRSIAWRNMNAVVEDNKFGPEFTRKENLKDS